LPASYPPEQFDVSTGSNWLPQICGLERKAALGLLSTIKEARQWHAYS